MYGSHDDVTGRPKRARHPPTHLAEFVHRITCAVVSDRDRSLEPPVYYAELVNQKVNTRSKFCGYIQDNSEWHNTKTSTDLVCDDHECMLLSAGRSDEMSPKTESWTCGFEGCGRVYYSERGIWRHYILLHRHRYRRGRAPLYIHDDREYERLKLRLRRRHRQPRTGSDDGDRRDDGDDGARPPATAVPLVESMIRSPRVSDISQNVSGRSQHSSAAVSGKGDSQGPAGRKGRHPGSYGPHRGSSGPSGKSDSRHGSIAGPSGHSERPGKQLSLAVHRAVLVHLAVQWAIPVQLAVHRALQAGPRVKPVVLAVCLVDRVNLSAIDVGKASAVQQVLQQGRSRT